MKRAILIHGWNTKDEYYDASRPTASNDHWFPWLTKKLMLADIHTVSLEMPNGYYPEYDVWKRELERFDIDENTILVGHSCGGGFLVRWLSEGDRRVGKVVLVAPWLGYGANSYGDFDENFFDFRMDRSIASRAESLEILYSTDDEPSIQKSVQDILEGIDDVRIHEFSDKGHFVMSSLDGEESPELLEVITR